MDSNIDSSQQLITRVAIVADLHDNLTNFENFLNQVVATPFDVLILAGDIGSPETYEQIVKRILVPIWAVAGNLETDIGKTRYAYLSGEYHHLKLSFHEPFVFSIGNTRIELRHHPEIALQSKGQIISDLVIFGHSHCPDLSRLNQTWRINPGTLSGWPNSATYAVAILQDKGPNLTLHRLEKITTK